MPKPMAGTSLSPTGTRVLGGTGRCRSDVFGQPLRDDVGGDGCVGLAEHVEVLPARQRCQQVIARGFRAGALQQFQRVPHHAGHRGTVAGGRALKDGLDLGQAAPGLGLGLVHPFLVQPEAIWLERNAPTPRKREGGEQDGRGDRPELQRAPPFPVQEVAALQRGMPSGLSCRLQLGFPPVENRLHLPLAGLVSDAANREHHFGGFRIALDLGAQPLDMHVDQPGVCGVAVAPDLLQQQFTGEHLPRLPGQRHQQIEFQRGQRDPLVPRCTTWPATSITTSAIRSVSGARWSPGAAAHARGRRVPPV